MVFHSTARPQAPPLIPACPCCHVGAGSGPAARQLHSQGLAAAAEFQKARAAVDDILLRIASSKDSSSSSVPATSAAAVSGAAGDAEGAAADPGLPLVSC